MFLVLLSLALASIPAPTLPASMNPNPPFSPSRTIRPTNGAQLQAALNSAVDNDLILLQPGVTYSTTSVGFLLSPRVSSGWVVVRTEGVAHPATDRVVKTLNLAKIQSANASPEFAYAILANTGGWFGFRFELVEIVGVNGQRRIVSITGGNRVAPTDPLPAGFIFDRVWIRPNAATDENSFGISGSANVRKKERFFFLLIKFSQQFALINSIVEDIHAATALNQESKCLGFIEGSVFLIDNNFLSAASISILFGGADPLNPAWIPSDITVTRNYFFKPLSWVTGPWFTIKNHFELKSGRRVLFEGNVCENSWPDRNPAAPARQSGYSLVLWSVGNPAETAHLTIRNNIITNTERAFSLTALR